jgi:spermidine dehydrogenase
LLAALGIKLERFHQAFQHRLYDDLDSAVFFDQQTFGEDRLVVGEPDADSDEEPDWAGFIGQFPLPESDRTALLALYAGEQNYLQALPLDGREAYLDSLSYHAYLKRHVGLSDKAIAYFQQRSSDEYGYRIDFLPGSYARYAGYPGFAGLGLEEDDSEEEPYIYHFPDGNAGVARLLVRDLIPAVAAGQGMDDVVNGPGGTARASALRVQGVRMGGKTGTAQVRRIKGSARGGANVPWKFRDHALFIAFAPVENPRYAISVVVEHGIDRLGAPTLALRTESRSNHGIPATAVVALYFGKIMRYKGVGILLDAMAR